MWVRLFHVTLFLSCLLPAAGICQTWRAIEPSGSRPAPRMRAAAVYDPAGRRLLLFGGRGAGRELGDLWAFDLEEERWTEVASGGAVPAPRSTHALLLDAATRRLLVWSGRQNDTFYADTWAYDLAAGEWAEVAVGETRPAERYGSVAVFDPVARGLVAFAGFTYSGRFGDTWRLAVDEGTWSDLQPDPSPGRRCLHAAAYDPQAGRMLIYGGQRDGGALADLWAFDLAQGVWTELTPADGPAGRTFASLAYDQHRHRLLLFGGNLGNDAKVAEVWSFDLGAARWQQVETQGTGPEPRDGAAAVYDPVGDRLLVATGAAPVGLFDDIWALELGEPGPAAVGASAWGAVKGGRR
ncbi:MAG: kelch repeat-containing protein [Candidatus Latescibacterota bacterium]